MLLKEHPSFLGKSKKNAITCLNSLGNRLVKESKFCLLYKTFLQEYLNLGHTNELTKYEELGGKYYITHHCVFFQESNSYTLESRIMQVH